MADHGLDGGATSQFAIDDAEHTALLSGDENAVWVCGVVAESAYCAPTARQAFSEEIVGVAVAR